MRVSRRMNPLSKWIVPALLPLVLAGCGTLATSGLAPEGDEAGGEPSAGSAQSEAAALPRALGGIVSLLEDGRIEPARAALVDYLRREPRSPGARSLLRQIDTDPVVLLGAAHVSHTVRPGETLGELAARHLGDPLQFVALARYNGIARPKALLAGQVVKLPLSGTPAAKSAGAVAKAAPPAAADAVSEGDRAEDARTAGERRAQQVRDYHQAAVVHYRNQQLDEAIALWDEALALDPAYEPARGFRLRALELKRRLRALEAS